MNSYLWYGYGIYLLCISRGEGLSFWKIFAVFVELLENVEIAMGNPAFCQI